MSTVILSPCPFCGQPPNMEPWHGGSPTKVMISCPGVFANSLVGSGKEEITCHVAPSVTGETPEEAAEFWNRRAPEREQPSDALADVAAERRRQVEVEGWTSEHDDTHEKGEMAGAAACYALYCSHIDPEELMGEGILEMSWPWDGAWWKPKDRRRDLVRAAALIIAEIERLDRAAQPAGPEAS